MPRYLLILMRRRLMFYFYFGIAPFRRGRYDVFFDAYAAAFLSPDYFDYRHF